MRKRAMDISDQLFYDTLGAELSDNSIIEAKIQEAYGIIREKKKAENNEKAGNEPDEARGKKGRTLWRKTLAAMGSTAAVLCLAFTICVMNPVLAVEIPILGSVFAKIADVYPFGKLPEENTVELPADGGFWAEDGGITIAVTEEYASNQAAYIGVKVENEQIFPKMAETVDSGQQFIKARTLEKYSFCQGQRSDRRYIEGKFVDEHTFLGIIRIDYDDIRRYMEESGMTETDIPESFTVELEITEIASTLKDAELPEEFQRSEEELAQMTEEAYTAYMDSIPKAWYGLEYQSWHQAGAWKFTLPVSRTDESAKTIEINQYNDDGIGVDSIAISPVEISVNAAIPEGASLCTVVFDADGRRIAYRNGSNAGTVLLVDHYDISTITVYICGISEYSELAEQYSDRKLRKKIEKIAEFELQCHTDE